MVFRAPLGRKARHEIAGGHRCPKRISRVQRIKPESVAARRLGGALGCWVRRQELQSTLSHTRNRAGAKNLRPNPQISPNLHLKCPFPLLLPPAILCPPFLKRFALGLLRVSMSPVLIWSPTKKRMSLKTRAAFGFELLLGRPSGPRGPLGSALKFWLRSFKLLGFEFKPALSAASRIHLRLQFAVFKLSERAVSCPDR